MELFQVDLGADFFQVLVPLSHDVRLTREE